MTPSDLFVAIPGETFDGHSFVEAALQAGATGILFEKGKIPDALMSRFSEVHFFPVENSVQAYRKLAQSWRAQFQIPVLAVAGSVGKTTTKEFLAAILRGKYKSVLKTEGSQNGFLGIPMTLLDLRAHHEVAVIEIGIDEMGAMKEHIQLVRPTGSLLTAIEPEHLEKLHTLENVTQEELLALTLTASMGGCVAINLDDLRISPIQALLPSAQGVRFGLTAQADQRTLSGKIQNESTLLISGLDFSPFSLPLPLPGEHNARNLLAAISLARFATQISSSEIQTGLTGFKNAYGRSEFRNLPNGVRVYCDYYNASPASMEAAFRVIESVNLTKGGTRWIVLGDMRELGHEEAQFHSDLAPSIIKYKFEKMLLLGPLMKHLENKLRETAPHISVEHFDSHDSISQKLKSQIRAGDLILIKGSRGMKMEKVWEGLQGNGKNAN